MVKGSRVPVIPLDYELRHIAVEHELIIDYDRGKLYIVVQKGDLIEPGLGSEETDSGDIIYDFTQTIVDEVLKNNLDTGRLSIFIEGIGNIKLEDFLNRFYSRAIDHTDSASKIAIPKESVFDMRSIVNHESIVQLNGFDEAETNAIPMKDADGTLHWAVLGEDGEGAEANGTEHGDVTIIEYVPDLGYPLVSSQAQLTQYVATKADVILPLISSQYAKIKWRIKTGINPVLIFPDNVTWEYKYSTLLDNNVTYVFELETWDKGKTWLGKYTKYGATSTTDETVNISYLSNNYYTKEEIDNMLSWDNDTIYEFPDPEGGETK